MPTFIEPSDLRTGHYIFRTGEVESVEFLKFENEYEVWLVGRPLPDYYKPGDILAIN